MDFLHKLAVHGCIISLTMRVGVPITLKLVVPNVIQSRFVSVKDGTLKQACLETVLCHAGNIRSQSTK